MRFLSWITPPYSGSELEAQIVYCFLLAHEAGDIIPPLPFHDYDKPEFELLNTLREVADREPGTSPPYSLVIPTVSRGLYVAPQWRAGVRLSAMQLKARKAASRILGRLIASREAEMGVLEAARKMLIATPDGGTSCLLCSGRWGWMFARRDGG